LTSINLEAGKMALLVNLRKGLTGLAKQRNVEVLVGRGQFTRHKYD
jgi:hypothetical protein